MIQDIQPSQPPEQLILTLAAMLGYLRLTPSATPSTDHINGSYLSDFNALLLDGHINNALSTVERMVLGASRSLDTSKDRYLPLRQFLATDKDVPRLDLFDGFTDQ
jgi:hypothetical protein